MAAVPLDRSFGTRRIFGNLGLLIGGKAGAGLLSLVYLVIVARSLGAHDYGVLVLIQAYITLVGGIIAFSGWHGVVRYGSLALERGDRSGFVRLVRFLTLVELSFGILAILAAILLARWAGARLGWPPEAVGFVPLFSLATLANVRSTPMGILQLEGRFDLISAHQLFNPVVRLVGSLLAWLGGGGLHAFLLVWLLSGIAEWVGMWGFGLWQLRRMKLGVPLLGPVRGTVAENAGLLPFITTTNFDITLRELAPRLVPLSIGWFAGPAAAGLFTLAQKASTILEQPALLLGQASYAVLAKFAAARDYAHLRHTVWRSAAGALLASVPVLVVLALTRDRLLTLIGGSSFAGGALLMLLLAAGRAIAMAAPPISSALIAIGLPSRSIIVNLLANLLLLPLLFVLLDRFGLQGAGWHAVIQSLVATVVLAAIFQRAARRLG
ncbi:oligosaccharide flippase family protein [Sphingomonas sp. ASV193]|uniref:lipopolysaccharide biosynthesis protein n=1 Tax=Sphingomonas sp. ASV193 TaxID=3144405 RepID=UPI0032E8D46E